MLGSKWIAPRLYKSHDTKLYGGHIIHIFWLIAFFISWGIFFEIINMDVFTVAIFAVFEWMFFSSLTFLPWMYFPSGHYYHGRFYHSWTFFLWTFLPNTIATLSVGIQTPSFDRDGHAPHPLGCSDSCWQSSTFHRKLKTHLFRHSYPDIVL